MSVRWFAHTPGISTGAWRACAARVVLVSCLLFTLWTPASRAQDFEALKAGVVKITAQREELRSTGTGFVVKVEGEDLYIVTASHVVEGDAQPQVTFHARRDVPVKARVVKLEGGDPRGIALLLVQGGARDARAVRPLPWARDDALTGGEDLVSIGFGQGQGEWAVIRVSVTAIDGRDIRLEGRVEEGNSGGPLLRDGRVVGLITGVRQGFGVASPGYIVAGTLRGWRVAADADADTAPAEVAAASVAELAAAAPPEPAPAPPPTAGTAADQVSLRATHVKAGRVTREENRFELRDAVLTVALGGQALQGSARIEQQQSLEREVMAVAQGRSTRERVRFLAMPGTSAREFSGEHEVEDRTSPLQGLTVIAVRSGEGWSYSAPAGGLSAEQRRELPGFFAADEDTYPSAAVAPGQQWEVSGPALHSLIQLTDFTVKDGKSVLGMERIQACGKARCARVNLRLQVTGTLRSEDGSNTLVDLDGTGHLIREVGAGITREMRLSGRMTLTGSIPGAGMPVEVKVSGPFTMQSTVKD